MDVPLVVEPGPNAEAARMRPPGPRFPFEPVDRLLDARFGMRHASNRGWHTRGEWWTDADAGEVFGVTGQVVQAWRVRGLSLDQSDRVACALGRHPCEVWPDWSAAADAWFEECEQRRQAAIERHRPRRAANKRRRRREGKGAAA